MNALLFVQIENGEINGLCGVYSNPKYEIGGITLCKKFVNDNQLKLKDSLQKAMKLGFYIMEVTDEDLDKMIGHEFYSDYIKSHLENLIPPELWL